MKPTTFFIFFLIAASFMLHSTSTAQSVSAVTANYQYTNPDQALLDTLDASLLQLEERNITATITLSSSDNISKIALMLGSTEGSNDIFYKEFDFGVSGTFADGTSYAASGNTLSIGLGRFNGSPQYFVGAYAIKSDGTMESGVNYVME